MANIGRRYSWSNNKYDICTSVIQDPPTPRQYQELCSNTCLNNCKLSENTISPPDMWAESRISFDDPMCYSYYTLAGYSKHFEAKGEEIFQGNVWAYNLSGGDLTYDMTEILV